MPSIPIVDSRSGRAPRQSTGPAALRGTRVPLSDEKQRRLIADAVRRKADIWMLGCVLLEMVAGNSVFDTYQSADEALGMLALPLLFSFISLFFLMSEFGAHQQNFSDRPTRRATPLRADSSTTCCSKCLPRTPFCSSIVRSLAR